MPLKTADNNFGTAKWIVSANYSDGCTHITIASALTSASSGDTIFIRPGTYTENLTLKSGVNLVAYIADSLTPNVTIVGKCTATFAGTASLSGIRLKTNSDFCLAVTGSSATVINLIECFIEASNNNAISYTSSSASSILTFTKCGADLDTTGIAYFTASGSGIINIDLCRFQNTGSSVTASTISAGQFQFRQSSFANPITSSGTGGINSIFSNFQFSGLNVTALTIGGSGTSIISKSRFISDTASAISISSSASISESEIGSSNTNAITGAGSITYGGLTFLQNSAINTTTQVVLPEGPSRTVGSSNPGGNNTHLVTNSSNTASSNAISSVTVGGSSAGDPLSTWTVSGVTNWTMGIDNSDSDKLKMELGAALGTNPFFEIDPTALLPTFLSGLSGTPFGVIVKHTVNSGSSDAYVDTQVAGSSGGDAYYKAEVSGGQAWTWGLDNSATDEFSLSASATLGTSEVLHMSAVGNLTVTYASSGAQGAQVFKNTNNTAGSGINLQLRVGGGTADDPYLRYAVDGVGEWSTGLDNSASDAYKISWANILGTNDTQVIQNTGEINFPLQPAFLAYVDTTITNVTGDGTVYTVIPDNEVFDQNGDFTLASGTFTAPVTGRYFLQFSILIVGGTVISAANARIVTSNRTYNNTAILSPGSTAACSMNMSVLADMDAADTATFTIATTDSGGKVDDVSGTTSGNLRTFVSGHLAC
jgi:hypothetical protein